MVLDQTMIDRIPFLHKSVLYNIITEGDLTFKALHHILDCLLEKNAFVMSESFADLYSIEHEEVMYTVCVDGMDVIINASL
jgi:chloramphenicol O-acetyltransferase